MADEITKFIDDSRFIDDSAGREPLLDTQRRTREGITTESRRAVDSPLLDTGRFTSDEVAPADTFAETFRRGAQSGMRTLQADMDYMGAIFNTLSGDEDAALENLELGRLAREQGGQLLEGTISFEDFVAAPTFSGLLDLTTSGVGMVTPMATVTAASAGVGGLTAVLGRGLMNTSGKAAAKQLLKEIAEKQRKGITLTPDELAVAAGTAKSVASAAKAGSITGAFIPSYISGSGQSFGEFDEAGVELDSDRARQALAIGAPIALIDTATEVAMVGSFLKLATKKARKDGQGVFAAFAANLGKEVAKNSAKEGAAELAQEEILIQQRRSVDDNYSAQEANLRRGEAAFLGAVAGGAFGTAGGVVGGIPAVARSTKETADKVVAQARQMLDQTSQSVADSQAVDESTQAELFDTRNLGTAPAQPEQPTVDLDAPEQGVQGELFPVAQDVEVTQARERNADLLADEAAFLNEVMGRPSPPTPAPTPAPTTTQVPLNNPERRRTASGRQIDPNNPLFNDRNIQTPAPTPTPTAPPVREQPPVAEPDAQPVTQADLAAMAQEEQRATEGQADVRDFNRTRRDAPAKVRRGAYKKSTGKPDVFVGAFYRKGDDTIFIDEEYLRSQFDKKPWESPRVEGVNPLPDEFVNEYINEPDDWVRFVELHEKAHTEYAQLEGESTATYENRMNDIAMAEMRDPRLFGTSAPSVAPEAEAAPAPAPLAPQRPAPADPTPVQRAPATQTAEPELNTADQAFVDSAERNIATSERSGVVDDVSQLDPTEAADQVTGAELAAEIEATPAVRLVQNGIVPLGKDGEGYTVLLDPDKRKTVIQASPENPLFITETEFVPNEDTDTNQRTTEVEKVNRIVTPVNAAAYYTLRIANHYAPEGPAIVQNFLQFSKYMNDQALKALNDLIFDSTESALYNFYPDFKIDGNINAEFQPGDENIADNIIANNPGAVKVVIRAVPKDRAIVDEGYRVDKEGANRSEKVFDSTMASIERSNQTDKFIKESPFEISGGKIGSKGGKPVIKFQFMTLINGGIRLNAIEDRALVGDPLYTGDPRLAKAGLVRGMQEAVMRGYSFFYTDSNGRRQPLDITEVLAGTRRLPEDVLSRFVFFNGNQGMSLREVVGMRDPFPIADTRTEQSIEAINAKTDDQIAGDVAARYFVEVANMSRDELYYRLGEDLEGTVGGLRIREEYAELKSLALQEGFRDELDNERQLQLEEAKDRELTRDRFGVEDESVPGLTEQLPGMVLNRAQQAGVFEGETQDVTYTTFFELRMRGEAAPEMKPLVKVISGGQDGVDVSFLDVASDLGISTGGTAPLGFKTESGNKPELLGQAYGLKESKSANYAVRTRKNVKDSDGTVIVVRDPGNLTPGSKATVKFAKQLNKPYIVVTPKTDPKEVRQWIANNNVRTLNGAGSRDISGDRLNTFLTEILQDDVDEAPSTVADIVVEIPVTGMPQSSIDAMKKALNGIKWWNRNSAEQRKRTLANSKLSLAASELGLKVSDPVVSKGRPKVQVKQKTRKTPVEDRGAPRTRLVVEEGARMGQVADPSVTATAWHKQLVDPLKKKRKQVPEPRRFGSFDKAAQQVITQAEKILGISTPMNFITLTELQNNFDAYTGPGGRFAWARESLSKRVEKMQKNPENAAGVEFLAGQSAIVVVNEKLFGRKYAQSDVGAALAIGHEIGHVFFSEEISKIEANPQLRKRMFDSFKKARAAEGAPVQYMDEGIGFEEWFSDQVSKYVYDSTIKATDGTQSKFKRIAGRLKRFFAAVNRALGGRFKQDRFFKTYMDDVVATNKKRNVQRKDTTGQYLSASQRIESRDLINAIDNDWIKKATRAGNKAYASKTTGFYKKFISTANARLQFMGPAGQAIAAFFQADAGKAGLRGMLQEAPAKEAYFTNKMVDILGIDTGSGENSWTSERIEKIMLEVEDETIPTEQLSTREAKELRALYKEAFEYNKDPDGNQYLQIRERKNFGGGRALSESAIEQRIDEFINFLMNDPETGRPRKDFNGNIFMDEKEAELTARYILAQPGESLEIAIQRIQEADYNQAIKEGKLKALYKAFDEARITPGSANQFVRKLGVIPTKQLREAGFLEPAGLAQIKYFHHLTRGVEYEKRGGSEFLKEQIANLPQEYKAEASSIIEGYLAKKGQTMKPWLRTFNSATMVHTTLTTLLLAPISSITDLSGVAMRGKEMKNMDLFFKNMMNAFKGSEAYELARRIGTIMQEGTDTVYITQGDQDFANKWARDIMHKFFKYTGLNLWTRYSRVVAVGMGRDFFVRNAEELSDPNITPERRETLLRWMAEGHPELTAEDVLGWVDGSNCGTDAQLRVDAAIRRFADESVVRPNQGQRPSWANDPRFQILFQLKSFFYAFGDVVVAGAIREGANRLASDGKFTGAGQMALLAGVTLIPLTMLGLEIRELIKYLLQAATPGIEATDYTFRSDYMDTTEYLYEIFTRTGVPGKWTLALTSIESLKWEGPLGPIITNVPIFDAFDESVFDGRPFTRNAPVINNIQ